MLLKTAITWACLRHKPSSTGKPSWGSHSTRCASARRSVSSIFGLPWTWLPPFSRYSEFKIIDLWRLGRTVEVPGQHLDPLHPAHAAELRPAVPQRPVLAAHRHLAAARSQRQLHDLPGRGLVLRQRHHDQRRGGADQLGLPRLSLPPAADDDPELDRLAVDRSVRVRAGQGVVSGGRAGDQGASRRSTTR